MKKLLYLPFFFVVTLLFVSCNKSELPRIGIGGIAIECSTFSPAKTTIDGFRVSRGAEIMDTYHFMLPDSGIVDRAVWLPALYARATPGGIVTRDAYETLTTEFLDSVKKNMPYDAFFFDIHGAMSVEGLPDPEGDLIMRLREVIGSKPIISTSTDLHGCVSYRLAQQSDIITTYRMAPHEDARISDQRAVVNLLDRLEQNLGKPKYKAWVKVPILLPGEKTSTRVSPGKELYAKVPEVADQEGVVDAGIWISYAWADEPRNHGVVVVIGDDKERVTEGAMYLAQSFWDVRNEFEFVAPTADLDICLNEAINSKLRPYFISDMGDNPTAGGAGDVTWTLHQLKLNKKLMSSNGPNFIYGAIPGPELVDKAINAGIGKRVRGFAGAAVDNRYAGPVEIAGVVEAIQNTKGNRKVVIKMGSMHIIVTEKRTPYHYEKDMLALGLDPNKADIVMVKLGYLVPDWYRIQKGWMMAHTRGGVDQDVEKLPYKGIERPMFPLDTDFDPKLEIVYIESSDK